MNKATVERLLENTHVTPEERKAYGKQIKSASEKQLEGMHKDLCRKSGGIPQNKRQGDWGAK